MVSDSLNERRNNKIWCTFLFATDILVLRLYRVILYVFVKRICDDLNSIPVSYPSEPITVANKHASSDWQNAYKIFILIKTIQLDSYTYILFDFLYPLEHIYRSSENNKISKFSAEKNVQFVP